MKRLSHKEIARFRHTIYAYYKVHKRIFPWRDIENPYYVLVSEVMLQQTQTERVLKKYPEFLETFPDIKALALSSPSQVYHVWQGLGYNRRALALKKAAGIILESYNGIIPSLITSLEALPGIGKATAGSIKAFAFNEPAVFIETNIRRVFIHYFFKRKTGVNDAEIESLVKQTLDYKHPRQWYYALMDYGVMLAKIRVNPNRRSRHYKKQSPFSGSNREIRGKVLRLLDAEGKIKRKRLLAVINEEEHKIETILQQLKQEGFIEEKKGVIQLC